MLQHALAHVHDAAIQHQHNPLVTGHSMNSFSKLRQPLGHDGSLVVSRGGVPGLRWSSHLGPCLFQCCWCISALLVARQHTWGRCCCKSAELQVTASNVILLLRARLAPRFSAGTLSLPRPMMTPCLLEVTLLTPISSMFTTTCGLPASTVSSSHWAQRSYMPTCPRAQ